MSGHGWDAKTLAEKMDVAESKVNDLRNERIPIDQDISERLENVRYIHKASAIEICGFFSISKKRLVQWKFSGCSFWVSI